MARRSALVASVGTVLLTICLAAPGPAVATETARTTCPTAWSVLPSPSPGNVNNGLLDVAANSFDDMWAVGNDLREIGPALDSQALILHWNGSAWSQVPVQGKFQAQLAGVAAFGTRNVWAVGWIVQGATESLPLIVHWDGTAWKPVQSPQIQEANLLSIAGNGSTDIWAVGLVRGIAPHLLAEHFNGTSWREVKTPNISSAYVDFESVVTVTPSNVWAVGYYLADSGNYAPLSAHWNGRQWSLVDVPDTGAAGSQLYDATVAPDGTVWAVGQATDTSGQASPVAFRWNGTSWVAPGTPPVGTNSVFYGVAAASTKALMAVGWSTDTDGVQHTFTESLRNGSWTVMPSPDAGGASRLMDVTFLPNASAMIAVGTANATGIGQTLVEAICV
jgi:hypothetical protein